MQHIVTFFFSSKEFIKNSGILFFVNIINAVLNYSLTIFVANTLSQNSYSLWIVLTGLIAILSTFAIGIQTEFTKQSARIAVKSRDEVLDFYGYFQRRMLLIAGFGVVVSPFLGFILSQIIGNGSILLFSLIVILVVTQISQSINTQFFLSLLKIPQFITLTIVSTISKCLFTIGLIYLQFGVFALPISLLIGQGISLIIGKILIHRLYQNRQITTAKTQNYHIFDHIWAMGKNTIVLFFLSLFFNSGPIVAERIFEQSDKDILAVLFNFGQIIHFGSVATLGGLMTYASRDNSKKIYFSGLLMVSGISVGVGIVFTFFGRQIMTLFGRPQYADKILLILYYCVFVTLFNLIFVSVQYLIARNNYKALVGFILATIVLIFSQLYLSKQWYIVSSDILNFITISSLISVVTCCYLITNIYLMKKTT
jgi:O-antigen/teichoic acid export membrane protein